MGSARSQNAGGAGEKPEPSEKPGVEPGIRFLIHCLFLSLVEQVARDVGLFQLVDPGWDTGAVCAVQRTSITVLAAITKREGLAFNYL